MVQAGFKVLPGEHPIVPVMFGDAVAASRMAELLLAKGADVNARSKEGATPLHIAAQEGHKDVVLLLLTHGAAVNPVDSKYGMTPTRMAAGNDYYDVVELLRRHGGHE